MNMREISKPPVTNHLLITKNHEFLLFHGRKLTSNNMAIHYTFEILLESKN